MLTYIKYNIYYTTELPFKLPFGNIIKINITSTLYIIYILIYIYKQKINF